MSTRTIVTSQPDVACDVCERRLLRGEQPDAFVAAGRRLIVCELCVPRAVHEGWIRESDTPPIALPPSRPRRGRTLLDRLWQVARAPAEQAPESTAGEPFDPHGAPAGEPAAAPARPSRIAGSAAPPSQALAEGLDGVAAEPSYIELGVAEFNASEFPRRVAGVARSLGAPEVTVRSAEHLSSVVLIVVAWELCWYRYEVDLSESPVTVRVEEQGTELGELRHDDRHANALATDDGVLVLAAGVS
jgi:hypothetical protein